MIKKIIGVILIIVGIYFGIASSINLLAWLRGMGSTYIGAVLLGYLGMLLIIPGTILFKRR